MSFDATNWAIKQRGLRPAAKIVLWHLCDRYHPDHGCFPSQDTLAEDCELPRSTLNVHLNDLEASGLIAREQRRERGNKRQESTRYRFPFEPGFEAKIVEKPGPETGHGSMADEGEAVSRNAGEPCPENGKSRVQNLDSNLVIEPVIEPVTLREREREDLEGQEQGEDLKKIEAGFFALVKIWPGLKGMPKEKSFAAWKRLTSGERTEATEAFPRWLALMKSQSKDHISGPYSYFHGKLWQEVPTLEEAAKPKNAMAAPFGKLWGATRLAELLAGVTGHISPVTALEKQMIDAGRLTLDSVLAEKRRKMGYPSVNTMDERARSRQGWICPLVLEEAAAGFNQVHRDGDLLQAWKREHERRNWPFPDTGSLPEWIYFPPIGEAANDPDIAVRDAVDAFADAISDYLQSKRGTEHAA